MLQECFKVNSKIRNAGAGKFRANMVVRAKIPAKLKNVGEIIAKNTSVLSLENTFLCNSVVRNPNKAGSLKPDVGVIFNPREYLKPTNVDIVARPVLFSGCLYASVGSMSSEINTFADKVGGHYSTYTAFDNFESVEKLYPSGDLIINSGNNYFVNQDLSITDLHLSIDEGISVGNYVKHGTVGRKISDDLSTYITPSSVLTKSDFRYKLQMTPPIKAMEESFLAIRASAPMKTYTSERPPVYTLSNLRLEDPSGNLITKYKDFTIQGDADYDNDNYLNFATYISEPEINNAKLSTDSGGYPIFGSGFSVGEFLYFEGTSGYTLNIDVNVSCLDDSFDDGFNFGFEDTCHPDFVMPQASGSDYLALDGAPFSTQNQLYNIGKPSDNLRISAIEILSSGSLFGLKKDKQLTLATIVPEEGLRASREILPSKILINTYDTTIHPSGENSIWKSNTLDYNTSENTEYITSLLRDSDPNNNTFIELHSTSSVADSGKLKLKFSHEAPTFSFQRHGGAFAFGNRQGGLQAAQELQIADSDSFFIVDEIELKITAKKASGSRDYVIDAVGYSDDKLLNVTSQVGGFLQNASGLHPSGIGVTPVSSGFGNIDDFGISSEAISDRFQYFETSGTKNMGGDHYSLPTVPIVNSTSFQEYTIPLKIYPERFNDFKESSYFEHLYLDLYPFPSGAAISRIALSFTYKPSNALPLSTVGHSKEELHRSKITAYPSGSQTSDRLLNSVVQNSGLSLIEGIPHGYTSPTTLKTNYARRWRGVDGNVVNGPFRPSEFDESFENPTPHAPFLEGFFDFNRTYSDNFVVSNPIGKATASTSGLFNGNIHDSIIENNGLRFNSSGLFPHPRPYKSIDWCQTGHPLEGKILDSFDRCVRLSGVQGNLDFGSGISVSGGFSAYIRFSPDVTISGSSYNLWDSGVLLSKWNSGKDLEFLLAYSGGHLAAHARDVEDNTISIYDSQDYTNYQYPLSVLLTYNDHLSSKLKLYVDNEIVSGDHNVLRASSTPFVMASGHSPVVAGFSSGSGVGINAFVTEVGLSSHNSSGTNIRESGFDVDQQQTTAESFFGTHRAKFFNAGESREHDSFKLWSFVDNNVDKWHLGAFSSCEYSSAYDRFTVRDGIDFINFNIIHSGTPYYQSTDLPLPSGSIETSGLAYHSQLENDMLRLDIATIPDGDSQRLYGNNPRITKNFPRGYNFAEKSMAVETILQNSIDNDVIWPNGKTGAKLIVSLYAPSKEPSDQNLNNAGLVSRQSHYLDASGCMRKITTVFSYNDWIDNSEPWATFNQSVASSEFATKYLSADIDNMFVQYDVAYPSGDPFDSNIKLHAINLKMHEALASGATIDASGFTLYSSGAPIALNTATLYANSHTDIFNSGLLLYSSGALPDTVFNSGLLMYASGDNVLATLAPSGHHLNLYTNVIAGSVAFNPSFSDGMFGHPFDEWDYNPVTNLVITGKAEKDLTSKMPIYVSNDQSEPQASNLIDLFMQTDGIVVHPENASQPLFVHGDSTLTFREGRLSLNTEGPQPSSIAQASCSLNVEGSIPKTFLNNSLNLHVPNYSTFLGEEGTQALSWTNTNFGTNILVVENGFSYLEANDEIRGVDLICFGACDGNSTEKCIDQSIIVHGEEYGGDCVDGGIFRAKRLYTNLATSGFKTDVGYDNHFYGIRKFTGLVPNAPYDITVVGQTAGSERKNVPKTLDWEYGFSENVGFSGIKLIADGIAGASGTVADPADQTRAAGDQYGRSVRTNGDYMIVGSPYHSGIDELGYDLGEAGSVLLYKRNPAPTGYDWSTQDHKAGFSLVTELGLPEGLKRDRSTTKLVNELRGKELPFTATQTNWINFQEGRNFGFSCDLSSSGNYPTVVIGAPNSRFARTFADPEPDAINVALFVFSKPFIESYYDPGRPVGQREVTFRNLYPVIEENNLLYKFFSNPATKINLKVIVCEPTLNDTVDSTDMTDPEAEGFVYKFNINNHGRNDTTLTQGYRDLDTKIYRQLQEIFHGPVSGVYPHDDSQPNSGIPAIVGALVDDSFSMGRGVLGSALDKFLDWYRDYSFASGVTDLAGNPRAGSTVVNYSRAGENWIGQAERIMDDVLDTGRMVSSNDFSLFANNVGTFNSSTSSFNVSPPSGGAVYVMDMENNNGVSGWNVIQKIDSPTVSNNISPDMFGHSVAISDNAEVIAIGSPYMNEAVQIYQRNSDINPASYVGSWLSDVGAKDKPFGYLRQKYRRWQTLAAEQGTIVANDTIYQELTPSGRLLMRIDQNVEQYSLIKTYTHNEMKPGGNWQWLYSKFAPTPRLGYSIDVNEDGSMVAAGAPTDSFLHNDNDFNLWWRPGINFGHYWYSSVNAGSVTVFESRKYYPHNNKAVEFTVFGNKHRELNLTPDNQNLFDHMNSVYGSIDFERLPDSEVDIPNDAGLAFIISPSVDALSDEILENIQNWLGLGDRHLVLVADDPIYEEDGAYRETTNVVNKILEKLDSRMKVVPPRNQYESLIGSNRLDGEPFLESDYNIIPSFVPTRTTHTYVSRNNLWASGVAHIVLNREGINESYSCEERKNIFFETDAAGIETGAAPSYPDLNDKCNMIPKHHGDLRAQWNDSCENPIGLGHIVYPVNLALAFGTATTTDYGCCIEDCDPRPATANMEPIPLVVAAEYNKRYTVIPAVPERIDQVPVWGQQQISTPTFAEESFNDSAFYWSADSNNYISLDTNLNATHSPSRFITDNDEAYGEKSILRAVAQPVDTPVNQPIRISHFNAIAKENYADTTSEVVLISSTDTELRSFLISGGDDKNILLYGDLLRQPEDQSKFVKGLAQLGGWTGRSSFDDGRENSYLRQLFDFFLPSDSNLVEGEESLLPHVDTNNFDAAWIANTANEIPSSDLRHLKEWLAKGNRKLFITYGAERSGDSQLNRLKKADVATDLCSKLGLKMKPLFLTNKARYANNTDFERGVNEDGDPLGVPTALKTYGDEWSFSSPKLESINFSLGAATPIDVREGGSILLSTYSPASTTIAQLVDDNFVIFGVPELLTGTAKVTFPVLPGSGYRVFIDTMSATRNEDYRMKIMLAHGNPRWGQSSSGNLTAINQRAYSPSTDDHLKEIKVGEDFINSSLTFPQVRKRLRLHDNPSSQELFQTDGSVNHESINVYIPSGDGTTYVNNNTLSIYFVAEKYDFETKEYTNLPATHRIVGVSGALVPESTDVTTIPVIIGTEDRIIPARPESIQEKTEFRPVSTSSLKYCPTDECYEIFSQRDSGSLIADGPMVAAQELYFQKPFDAGVNRSRITVLTDASMIQGNRIANENGVIHTDVVNFLTSLYPRTHFPDENQGRQYNIISKITAPIKGSPQKFFNSVGNSGLMIRFAGDGTTPTSGLQMNTFSDTVSSEAYDDKGRVRGVIDVGISKASRHLIPDDPPFPDGDQIEAKKRGLISSFDQAQYTYGGTARFSGIVDGELYTDAFYGGKPQVMIEKGYDYLDFDKFPSGYPGDLFGYSVSLDDDRLLVGQPFGAFTDENSSNPVIWNQVSGTLRYEQISGTDTSYCGGAGSAFLFERGSRVLSDYGVEAQSKSWSLSRKFRPSSINVGQDFSISGLNDTQISQSGFHLGVNNYKVDDLRAMSLTPDQFGYSVDMHKDVIAIGAPGHDFPNFVEMIYARPNNSGAFNHKEFGESVDIPERNVYDMGESGVRYQHALSGSGVTSVLNVGAVYTYENAVTNWQEKQKGWTFKEKIIPQGYKSREQKDYEGSLTEIEASGSENDSFGRSVSIFNKARSDSNYALMVGTPRHKCATSGIHTSFASGVDTGAVYIYDGMLRVPNSVGAHPDAFIQAKVYSESGIDRTDSDDFISLNFSNSGQYGQILESSGRIYANPDGEIFLEASGQDPAEQSYSIHRPFIKQITGQFVFGTPETGIFRLFASGEGPLSSGSMNLYNQADTSAIVYNNLGLYASSSLGSISGVFEGSGLTLYSSGVLVS